MVHCQKRLKRAWWCSRFPDHDGSCALVPRWWNLVEWVRYCKNEFWRG